MSIYIESYTESHRNTQNINIQHKTHQKHQFTFSNSTFSKNRYFQESDIQKHQRFVFKFMVIFILLRPTQPN